MSQADRCPACERCNSPIDPDDTSWPGEGAGVLCQMCWEDYSSRTWWEMLRQLPALCADDAQAPGE